MKSRQSFRLKTIHFFISLMICLGWVTGSAALTLDEAKSRGLLGEMSNGYLGIVSASASPEAKALMKDINRKRRQKYQEISRKNGTKLEAVETLAGKTVLKKTKPGHYIKTPSGKWIKKPR